MRWRGTKYGGKGENAAEEEFVGVFIFFVLILVEDGDDREEVCEGR